VKEYAQIIRTLAPNTPRAPSNETIKVLHLLHPLVEVDLPLFVDDFHLEIEVTLDRETFVSDLVRSLHLFSIGLSSMVYELLRDYFVPNDFTSGFDLFFEVCGHIAQGHGPPLISCFLSTSPLLALEKQSESIHPITINEVTYCLVAHILVI
jgi:hypothetical protein